MVLAVNPSPQSKNALYLALGAVLLLLGLLWLWSSGPALPQRPSLGGIDPWVLALVAASALAAGWVFLRSRHTGAARLAPTASTDPSTHVEKLHAETGEDFRLTQRWLLRFAGVVAAALLVGLVIGNLTAVVYAFAITGVVVAFTFMLILMPRGL